MVSSSSPVNPILNNPYAEPTAHYNVADSGEVGVAQLRDGRRPFTHDVSAVPVPAKQLSAFGVSDFNSAYENQLVNLLRAEMGKWRSANYPGTTAITRTLLFHWFGNPLSPDPLSRDNPRKLFFAQREAIETAIWLTEVAPTAANVGAHVLNVLRIGREQEQLPDNTALPRTAFRMATGSGKTVVMAALILYHYFNYTLGHNSDRRRYAGNFLLVAPGVTIRDRLGSLRVDPTSNDRSASDYYRQRGLVPPAYERELAGLNSRIVITNYHAFEPRMLQGNKRSPTDGKLGTNKQDSKESLTLVINRVLGKTMGRQSRKAVLVLNDEAHHCYLPLSTATRSRRPTPEQEEAENPAQENERAATWYRGLAEVARLYDVRGVYDFSATPYYLSGSGRPAYSPFPWIVSSFDLVEAIESGLVKIPFMPVGDNSDKLKGPALRDLYAEAKKEQPNFFKAGNRAKRPTTEPILPGIVNNALAQIYRSYQEDYERIGGLFSSPPVLIIVCNNTAVSQEVFRRVAGYERPDAAADAPIKQRYVPGHLELFSNYDVNTYEPLDTPSTLLIDSGALESGDQINDEFRRVFAPQIEQFRRDVRLRGGDPEALTDENLLREITNTVGRPGKLGARIRCVVSVSMLTEGWDANTVTHIVGLRAFGSQLLCEQVAGRALRRRSYDLQGYDKAGNPTKDPRRVQIEKLVPEYAQIIGIPFRLYRAGKSAPPPEPPAFTDIRALADRSQFEIRFPNVTAYRVLDDAQGALTFEPTKVPDKYIIGAGSPTRTSMGTGLGTDSQELTLDELATTRAQHVHFWLAQAVINRYYPSQDGRPSRPANRFMDFVAIARQWYDTMLTTKGDSFKQMVMLEDPDRVANHIKRGIVPLSADAPERRVTVELDKITPIGSTAAVYGRTSRDIDTLFKTTNSHVNYVVPDTTAWEQKAAKALEELVADGCMHYVKNSFLDFRIPYLYDGYDPRHYLPDFLVRVRPPHWPASAEPATVMLEITGFSQDKNDKRDYVQQYWVPAVNALDPALGFGQWAFLECTDPGDVKPHMRNLLASLPAPVSAPLTIN